MATSYVGNLLSQAIDGVRRGMFSVPESRPRVTRKERRRRSKDRARRLHGAHLMDVQDDYSDTAR